MMSRIVKDEWELNPKNDTNKRMQFFLTHSLPIKMWDFMVID